MNLIPLKIVSTLDPNQRAIILPTLKGEPGPIGNAQGALLVTNRLAELATSPAAQQEAQSNIGLGNVDPLAYYILAKA